MLKVKNDMEKQLFEKLFQYMEKEQFTAVVKKHPSQKLASKVESSDMFCCDSSSKF